jgi:hypothetical protein
LSVSMDCAELQIWNQSLKTVPSCDWLRRHQLRLLPANEKKVTSQIDPLPLKHSVKSKTTSTDFSLDT